MTKMKSPVHPGRIVASAIEAEGWTVTHTAERLGVSRAFLSRILHGHASITTTTALRLEALGWSDADHWMRMQVAHDLARERSGAAAANQGGLSPHYLPDPTKEEHPLRPETEIFDDLARTLHVSRVRAPRARRSFAPFVARHGRSRIDRRDDEPSVFAIPSDLHRDQHLSGVDDAWPDFLRHPRNRRCPRIPPANLHPPEGTARDDRRNRHQSDPCGDRRRNPLQSVRHRRRAPGGHLLWRHVRLRLPIPRHGTL